MRKLLFLLICMFLGLIKIQAQTILVDYPWLNNIVDFNNCPGGSAVTEYQSGVYSFIFVETNNSGTLYFQDGTFYCTDASNFSCVEAYGFTQIGNSWMCEGGSEPEPPSPPIDSDLFETYSWLSNYVSPNDCILGEEVIVYASGIFKFLYLNEQLYFQDGTFYCADGANFSCVSAYGLTLVENSWTCTDGMPEPEPPITEEEGIFEEFPWLYDYLDPNNCSEGEFAREFDLGPYSFIKVSNGNLYYQDGTFYCADAPPNFYCLTAYGINPSQTAQYWECEDEGEVIPPELGCIISVSEYQFLSDNTIIPNGHSARFSEVLLEGDSYYFVDVKACPSYQNPSNPDGEAYKVIYDCAGNEICWGDTEINCFDVFGFVISTETLLYEVTCEDNSYIPELEHYDWLNDLINENDCSSNAFVTYYPGPSTFFTGPSYAYFWVADLNGHGTLYFDDGTVYCNSLQTPSCLSTYTSNLEGITMWECD